MTPSINTFSFHRAWRKSCYNFLWSCYFPACVADHLHSDGLFSHYICHMLSFSDKPCRVWSHSPHGDFGLSSLKHYMLVLQWTPRWPLDRSDFQIPWDTWMQSPNTDTCLCPIWLVWSWVLTKLTGLNDSVFCLILTLLNSFIGFLGQFIGATVRLLHLSCSSATMIQYYPPEFSVNLLGPYSSETFLCDLGNSNEGILGIASIKTNFIQILENSKRWC